MLLTALVLFAVGAPNCRHIGESLRAARYDREVLRPGDETAIQFVYRDGPDGEKTIPPRCITDLRVKGPARLRGRQRLQVRSDARLGQEIALSMRIGGLPYSRVVKVTGRDQQVLTGTWHVVESQHCPARLPSEIRFFDNGGYDFTFPEAMVETMTSGRGSYTWDQASGALSLGGEWRGIARFEGTRLVMVGPYFDFAYMPRTGERAPPPCRIVLG